jgi:hypothetical protein
MIASTADGAASAALGFQILAYADVWVFENALRNEMGALRRAVTEQRSD